MKCRVWCLKASFLRARTRVWCGRRFQSVSEIVVEAQIAISERLKTVCFIHTTRKKVCKILKACIFVLVTHCLPFRVRG